ncbi:unnamed protein product, partial [Effrenium voratum]
MSTTPGRLETTSSLGQLFGSEGLQEGPAIAELLRARRLFTLQDMVYLAPWELRDWLLSTEEEAEELLQRGWAALAAPPRSAW